MTLLPRIRLSTALWWLVPGLVAFAFVFVLPRHSVDHGALLEMVVGLVFGLCLAAAPFATPLGLLLLISVGLRARARRRSPGGNVDDAGPPAGDVPRDVRVTEFIARFAFGACTLALCIWGVVTWDSGSAGLLSPLAITGAAFVLWAFAGLAERGKLPGGRVGASA